MWHSRTGGGPAPRARRPPGRDLRTRPAASRHRRRHPPPAPRTGRPRRARPGRRVGASLVALRRVDARTRSGRRVMDFGYDDVVPDSHGWGVHRGVLFELLLQAVRTAAIPVHTGMQIDGIADDATGWRLVARPLARQTASEGPTPSERAVASERIDPFDLVIGADGARSRLRRWSGLARKDVGYPYGALWCVVPDPDHLAARSRAGRGPARRPLPRCRRQVVRAQPRRLRAGPCGGRGACDEPAARPGREPRAGRRVDARRLPSSGPG